MKTLHSHTQIKLPSDIIIYIIIINILLTELNYIFTQNYEDWKQETLVIKFKLDRIRQKLKIYLWYKDKKRFDSNHIYFM